MPSLSRLRVLAIAALLVAPPLVQGETSPPDFASAARHLAERRFPGLAPSLTFETIPAEEGRDVFEIESVSGRIVLRGNTGVALASALNRYLEEFCQAQLSWNCGDQLALPSPAPSVPRKLRVASPHRYRYAYNFCTHGYTMAWWDWPRWERELDFLALKGVNLALVTEGQEQVWIDALTHLGYAEAAARSWLCLPSHQPWQFMGNIEGYGGPLSPEMVLRRAALGRRIVDRMRELGLAPVLLGYYGLVPADFQSRYPQANVHRQGLWGGMKRPDLLDPRDPEFSALAAAFYRAEEKTFGAAHFFAADPFHEGGITEGVDLGACGRAIQAAMACAQPESTWVLQSWQENPRQTMVDALDKSRLLVLDLNCEASENWRTRNQFGQTPWLWCTIQNYGGNVGLGSDLETLRTRPSRALAEAGPGRGMMRGLGALMEGSETQPLVWELFFHQAWTTQPVEFESWLRDYGRRRYGAASDSAVQALRLLLASVYSPVADGAPLNSVVCARPSLEPFPKARLWGTTQARYESAPLVGAWDNLLAASDRCSGSDGYRYDLTDLSRQVLADLAGKYHRAALDAFARKDAAELRRWSSKMLGLLDNLDRLLASRRELLLGPWLAEARRAGTSPEEKDRCERAARELVTTWNDADGITDYANRQWAGLVGSFYRPRWQTWLDALQSALAHGQPLDVAAVQQRIREADLAWTRCHDAFPTEPTGDVVAIARQLVAVYRADAVDPVPEPQPHSP